MKNTAAEFIRRAAFVDAMSAVSNTGRFHMNEGLADILRDYTGPIQVVDACDLH